MRHYVVISLSLILLLFFVSCGVSDAELVADQYHEKLDAKEYQFILDNLVDKDILENSGEEAWIDLFEYMDTTWGKLISRTKDTGFDSQYDNGVTSVQLNYTSEHAKMTMYERLYLLKEDKEFKITGILVNESKEGIEERAKGF